MPPDGNDAGLALPIQSRCCSLGSEAACVQAGTGSTVSSTCAWFDNYNFGEIISPTMNAIALAGALHVIRPSVELVSRK